MATTLQSHAALSGCLTALDRCLILLDQIDDGAFSYSPDGHGSAGEHLRHCIDHFDCFLRDLGRGVIDYDARTRSQELESDRGAARDELNRLIRALREVPIDCGNQPIRVRQTASPDEAPVETNSTLVRELMFLSGHTVHHVALMVLIAERAGARPETNLGVAYSTAAFRAGQSA